MNFIKHKYLQIDKDARELYPYNKTSQLEEKFDLLINCIIELEEKVEKLEVESNRHI